jgi:hypothetical protein
MAVGCFMWFAATNAVSWATLGRFGRDAPALGAACLVCVFISLIVYSIPS